MVVDEETNDGHGWLVGKEVCRACGAWAITVVPADIPEPENMECYKCGHMTMELQEE